ncbi:hypothetical protein PLEOSDRAFT_159707 [Pleurotus ostreatus PC15]|uniref:Uncharacterized protein n=1 Tax=Pleurotus ostreatus (strain PC15) TaxID=1137138 RepID=A0A067NED4_PLEO1|nr:hypothetical protein PLEOSDRAFT_159707 [Pleurotus ostreatus PC15]
MSVCSLECAILRVFDRAPIIHSTSVAAPRSPSILLISTPWRTVSTLLPLQVSKSLNNHYAAESILIGESLKFCQYLMKFPLVDPGLVAATPLRVIMASSHTEVTSGLRFGMPAAHSNANVAQIADPMSSIGTEAGPQDSKGAMRRPCHFHSKAIGLYNAFRKILGLPLIEHAPAAGIQMHGGVLHTLPFIGTPLAADTANGSSAVPLTRPDHNPHVHKNGASFMRRLHFALMALGPWEGRAGAFVLVAVLAFFFCIVRESFDNAEENFVTPPHYLADEKQRKKLQSPFHHYRPAPCSQDALT